MPTGAVRSIYAVIEFVDKATRPIKELNQAMNETRSRLSKFTEAIEKHKAAIAGLGAALSAIGYGGFRIFGGTAKDFERAIFEMQARTGVTRRELEKMTLTLKELARTNSDAFQSIAGVLTILIAVGILGLSDC